MCTPASWAGKHAVKTLAKRSAEAAAAPSPAQRQRTLFFGKPAAAVDAPLPAEAAAAAAPLSVAAPSAPLVDTPLPVAVDAPVPPPSILALDTPWCECHQLDPVSVHAVVLQPEATKRTLHDWVVARLAKRSDVPRVCVLSGPSGSGKRALVRTVSRVLGVSCMEPDVITLEEVCEVLREDVATQPLTLGLPRPRRVWLVTGLDGLFKSAASNSNNTSAKCLKAMLAMVDRAGYGMEPLVFTVHDFEGQALQQLRTHRNVLRLGAYRLQVGRPIEVALGRIADMAGLPRTVLTNLLRAFDGDMKQAILRLEFACRAYRKGDSPTVPIGRLHSKDSELTDPFEATRLLLNPRVPLQAEFLCEAFDKFIILETLVWCNYMAGVGPGHMDRVAAMADGWTAVSAAAAQYANPALKDCLRLWALMTLRHCRAAAGCHALTLSTKLAFAPKPSKFDKAAWLAGLASTDPIYFRLTAVERLERLEVASLYQAVPEYEPLCGRVCY